MNWSVTEVTAPTSEPLSLLELKDWIREDLDEQDALLSELITDARAIAENYLRRAIPQQTLALHMDMFPEVIKVPRPPLVSVTSIEYVDADGATQTLSSSLYRVDADSDPGRITPSWDNSWPTTRYVTGAVTVTYVAGYASCPTPIKRAIARIVADQVRWRGDTIEGSPGEISMSAKALLTPYRTWL